MKNTQKRLLNELKFTKNLSNFKKQFMILKKLKRLILKVSMLERSLKMRKLSWRKHLEKIITKFLEWRKMQHLMKLKKHTEN